MRRSQIVHIACCPIHGLHGERTECFVCGGPVAQIPMRPLWPLTKLDIAYGVVQVVQTIALVWVLVAVVL